MGIKEFFYKEFLPLRDKDECTNVAESDSLAEVCTSSIACFACSAVKQRLHRLDVVTTNHQKIM